MNKTQFNFSVILFLFCFKRENLSELSRYWRSILGICSSHFYGALLVFRNQSRIQSYSKISFVIWKKGFSVSLIRISTKRATSTLPNLY